MDTRTLDYNNPTVRRKVSPQTGRGIDVVSAVGPFRVRSGDVRGYLSEHPQIQPLLTNSFGILRDIFGPEMKPELELFQADDEPEDRSLIVWIGTRQTVPESLELYSRFESDWWHSQMANCPGQLRFILDYLD